MKMNPNGEIPASLILVVTLGAALMVVGLSLTI